MVATRTAETTATKRKMVVGQVPAGIIDTTTSRRVPHPAIAFLFDGSKYRMKKKAGWGASL
jgi:hypothetical protein